MTRLGFTLSYDDVVRIARAVCDEQERRESSRRAKEEPGDTGQGRRLQVARRKSATRRADPTTDVPAWSLCRWCAAGLKTDEQGMHLVDGLPYMQRCAAWRDE
jgi:hypothetical protein